jgi:hypothetical protein
LKPIDIGTDPIHRIYRGLVEEAEAEAKAHRKPALRFRASEITDCRRKIFYRLSGYVPFPRKPWLSLVAESGNLHHDYFRYLANHFEMGLKGVTFNEDGTQTELDNQAREFTYDGVTFTLSCRPDGLIDLPQGEAIMEVKTMTTFQFEKMQSAWKKAGNGGVIGYLELEKPSYLWQGNQTALIMERDYVYLMCIDRNLNRIGFSGSGFGKPHTWDAADDSRAGGAVWQVEDNDRENILAKAADVAQAVTDGKPPTAEYTASSTECGQCDFFIYCHGKKKGMEYPVKGVL